MEPPWWRRPSTLPLVLAVMALLIVIVGGSIRINDAEMVDVPAERRRVGMVFQSYALFPHLNVWDNLELGLRMRGGSAANRDERIRGVLEVLQLSVQARQRPSQLAGGPRQRVGRRGARARQPEAERPEAEEVAVPGVILILPGRQF